DKAEQNSVDSHFNGVEPSVRKLYNRLLATARKFGPVQEEAKKTSIHLARSSALVGVRVRKTCLLLTIKSDTEWESPRVHKSERLSANRMHHELRVSSLDEFDDELKKRLKRAYELSE